MQQTSTLARLLAAALLSATASAAVVAAEPPQSQAVAQTQTAQDSTPAAQVAAALRQDAELAALSLSVSGDGGLIVLSGNSPSAELAAKAVKLAQSVPGVKEVRSDIKIAS